MSLSDQAEFLKVLGEPNRLKLIEHLCRCCESETVQELCRCCEVDMSVVSRHLKVLAEASILSAEKQGRQKVYRVEKQQLAKRLRELADLIEES